MAIFATEWGTCDASGDGTLNLDEAAVRTCNEMPVESLFLSCNERTAITGQVAAFAQLFVHLTNQPSFPIFSKSTDQAKTWLDFFKEHNISDANWAISDKQDR